MTLMAGRERRSMMTGSQAAHCGSVSALSLGLPVSTAIPEAKGTLPKALFVGKAPISGKLKQRLGVKGQKVCPESRIFTD